MVIKENKGFTLKAETSKGEPFCFKPKFEISRHNYHKHNNGKGFKFINSQSYYIPVEVRMWFFWWCFTLKLKPELISGIEPVKYVRFEETHLPLLDLEEGNWDDN